MSEFNKFGSAVHNAFNTMLAKDNKTKDHMFVVDVTGDELWEQYLASFPAGTNPIYRERTEYDCSCCRNFVKNIGPVVFVKDGVLTTVWDSTIDHPYYSVVSEAMAAFVRSKAIKQHFLVTEPAYGALQTNTKGEIWNHFHAKVPNLFIARQNVSNYIGNRKDDVNILRRSIVEITDEAVDVVSELIAQNSLYRGDEHKASVTQLKTLKVKYNKLKTEREKELFLWTTAKPQTRIRNTVIGTLLTDISEGVELERAVASFESKVAPANYKRPKALITQKMIDEARKQVEALGIEDSLSRRYAVREDISVNDVLFVDGVVKKQLLGGAFDTLKPTKKNTPVLDRVEDISIKDFLANVLPQANELEVFVKNTHVNNFVSLIAPEHSVAKPLFKWDNAFSWSYAGEVTDSIKERVKKAGGKVDGAVRVSLSWFNGDDLDLSVRNGRETLYFANKREFGAVLDVDMNAGWSHNNTDPVENIVWARETDIQPGSYDIVVHNFAQRSTSNVGFDVEVEVLGKLYHFAHPQVISSGSREKIGTINVDKNRNITVEGLKAGGVSGEKWGIKTEEWVSVDLITRSPNFWNGQQVGNEHVFFMLKGCANEEGTRGFYNEYLRDDLIAHRKVFEVLAGNMKVEYNENQLSGVGFSTTKRDEILVRVKGSVHRVLNVKF